MADDGIFRMDGDGEAGGSDDDELDLMDEQHHKRNGAAAAAALSGSGKKKATPPPTAAAPVPGKSQPKVQPKVQPVAAPADNKSNAGTAAATTARAPITVTVTPTAGAGSGQPVTTPAGGAAAPMYVLEPDKMSVRDFELLHVVGRGAYGKVFQVRKHSNGKIYAMKVLKKRDVLHSQSVNHATAERAVLAQASHPFIVNLRYAFQSDSKLYLILDYAAGGELFTRLDISKSLDEPTAAFYAAEVVLALEHLHSRHIVYRDLKPENVLIHSDGHICLTDFGFAKAHVKKDTDTNTFCGTVDYMAPEIVQESGHGKAADWWSLGILIHEMLLGRTPFHGANRKATQEKIISAPLKLDRHLSHHATSLLKGLLSRPIAKRLGCEGKDAASIKAHSFFRNVDWEKLERRQVTPPFVPKIVKPDDVSNFDAKFTKEAAIDSPPNSIPSASAVPANGANGKADGDTKVAPRKGTAAAAAVSPTNGAVDAKSKASDTKTGSDQPRSGGGHRTSDTGVGSMVAATDENLMFRGFSYTRPQSVSTATTHVNGITTNASGHVTDFNFSSSLNASAGATLTVPAVASAAASTTVLSPASGGSSAATSTHGFAVAKPSAATAGDAGDSESDGDGDGAATAKKKKARRRGRKNKTATAATATTDAAADCPTSPTAATAANATVPTATAAAPAAASNNSAATASPSKPTAAVAAADAQPPRSPVSPLSQQLKAAREKKLAAASATVAAAMNAAAPAPTPVVAAKPAIASLKPAAAATAVATAPVTAPAPRPKPFGAGGWALPPSAATVPIVPISKQLAAAAVVAPTQTQTQPAAVAKSLAPAPVTAAAAPQTTNTAAPAAAAAAVVVPAKKPLLRLNPNATAWKPLPAVAAAPAPVAAAAAPKPTPQSVQTTAAATATAPAPVATAPVKSGWLHNPLIRR